MQVRVKSKKELLKILNEMKHPIENQSIEDFLSEEAGYNTFETRALNVKKEYTRNLLAFDFEMFEYCDKIINVEKIISHDAPCYFKQTDRNSQYWAWFPRWVKDLTKTKIEML